MGSLPFDVWSLILHYCTTEARWLAATRRVCRRFRRAVASIPHARIEYRSPTTVMPTRVWDAVRCFTACRSLILHLPCDELVAPEHLWAALRDCTRLKDLDLRIPCSASTKSDLVRFLDARCSALESLRLECMPVSLDPRFTPTMNAAPPMLRLTSLNWVCHYSKDGVRREWIPRLDALLDLTLPDAVSDLSLREAVMGLTRLTRLSLPNHTNGVHDGEVFPVPSTLARLRVLEVGQEIQASPTWQTTLCHLTALEAIAVRPTYDFFLAEPPSSLRRCTLLGAVAIGTTSLPTQDVFARWVGWMTSLQAISVRQPSEWMLAAMRGLSSLRSLSVVEPLSTHFETNFWVCLGPFVMSPDLDVEVSRLYRGFIYDYPSRFRVPAVLGEALDRPIRIIMDNSAFAQQPRLYTSLREYDRGDWASLPE